QHWDDVRPLTVVVDRLRRWYRPGLLCIGDAAHAMSPIGGVGINLAIQDAVAAANLLAPALRAGGVTTADLMRVQQRRSLPTDLTEGAEVYLRDGWVGGGLGGGAAAARWPLRLWQRWPSLGRIPAYFIGMGVRADPVRTPDAFSRARFAPGPF